MEFITAELHHKKNSNKGSIWWMHYGMENNISITEQGVKKVDHFGSTVGWNREE